jgi:DNA-binding transcriptional regulator YbjK
LSQAPPPRPPRGEARRGLIVEAALRVVGEEGAGALTHRRVAAEAGLPLAATTYWFASKDELLAEAYRLAADRDIARMRDLARTYVDRAATDLAAALTELLTAELAAGRTSLIASYALWIEAARRPALRAIEHEWTTAYVNLVQDILRAAGSPHPATDAQLLVATLDGLLLQQLATDDADPDTQLRPQLDRLVAALLRVP